jgi:Na+/H+-translocating membrane pyrophosphatase
VLVTAVIAAIVLARIQIAPGRRVIGRVSLLLLIAGLSGIVAFVDRGNVSEKKLLQVGWGLNLTLVAAISLGLAAIAVHVKRPSRSGEASDIEDTPA